MLNIIHMHPSYLHVFLKLRDPPPRCSGKEAHQASSSNRGRGVPGVAGAWRFPKVCQQLGDWRMYLQECLLVGILQLNWSSSSPGFSYLAIASRKRLLYSLGLVTVGLFRPPPANPRFLIQLSSCLSQV